MQLYLSMNLKETISELFIVVVIEEGFLSFSFLHYLHFPSFNFLQYITFIIRKNYGK